MSDLSCDSLHLPAFRYIVFEIVFVNKKPVEYVLNNYDVNTAIRAAVLQAHGDFGLGILQNSLHVKYMSNHQDVILVKARRGAHKLLQTAVTMFLKKIKTFDVVCRTLHIGGTIKACQKFLLQYYRKQLPALMLKCSNLDEMKEIQEVILSTCCGLESDKKLGCLT
ncbi:hypothetical protein LOTGIDRAFT_231547 [Lottia gigantea]|uniref:Ribonuclease P/MRP protein subunit POP5 n=1 Tax=Lottia gigantea TaxID=225164 RepID=V4AJU5_LOTGI|nr:hypothetical protein LOTGIDRAFT_231547 [Lottia gigantea]ESO97352.1 hypothetical protein LOTGIDRAFT_231547 [Lottia gigantea]